MDFWRKSIPLRDWYRSRTQLPTIDGDYWPATNWSWSPILPYFSNFGFVNWNGSKINPDDPGYPKDNSHLWALKWGNDTSNNYVLYLSKGIEGANSWGYTYTSRYNNAFMSVNLRDDVLTWDFMQNPLVVDLYTSNNTWHTDGHISGTLDLKMFFLPVANGGFILNTRLFDTQDQVHDPDGAEYRGQTPTFVTSTSVTNDNDRSMCKTLIGLPPSHSNADNNEFKYLIISDSGRPTKDSIQQGFLGKDTSALLPFNFVQSLSPTDSYEYHNNINKDVVTLIRYPWGSGFLDNLYIMSTIPSASFATDNPVYFSINNKSYVKIYKNLVVELPNN